MTVPDFETVLLITRNGMGDPERELLKSLEAKGVRLILCSTYLNYYNPADRVRVGSDCRHHYEEGETFTH